MLALRERSPALLSGHVKPNQRHGYELDPNSRLGRGLVSLTMMEGGQQIGGFRDVAAPGRVLTVNGTAYNRANSPFGGSTAAGASNSYIAPSPLLAFTTAFTVSARVLIFTGGTNQFQSWGNQGAVATLATLYFDRTANVYGCDVASATITPPTVWHRVTVTVDSVANVSQFYIDGRPNGGAGTASAWSGNVDQIMGDTNNGVVSPTVDLFYWSRALSAAEVAMHSAAPYASVLRPRYAGLNRTGLSAVVARTPYNFAAQNMQPILVQ